MSEWISVKDRLPDIGIEVLVYLSSYNGGSIRTDQRYTNQSWMWYEDYDITHWMPLPEPPKTQLYKCERCGLLVDKGNIYSLSVYPASDVPLMICDDCCSSFYKWFNEG